MADSRPGRDGQNSHGTVADQPVRPRDADSIHPDHPDPSRTRPTIAITIDPVALITTECITVTSAMRKHARWAKSSVSAILGGNTTASPFLDHAALVGTSTAASRARAVNGPPTHDDEEEDSSLAGRWGLRGKKGKSMQDNPLLAAFARLRRDLAGCHDVSAVDAPALLHPFLQVIRSSSTSAAITSLAVIAITKFLAYNIITVRSPRIAVAMAGLSAAVTHCRFEASDSAADEVVLLRILKLMETIITRPEGRLLGDESICEMMSTGLSMCCQARLSEVLRRSAEMAMVTMCQVIFSRLTCMAVETLPPVRSRANTMAAEADDAEIRMKPSLNGDMSAPAPPDAHGTLSIPPTDAARPSLDGTTDAERAASMATAAAPTGGEASDDVPPYGLPSIKELFRVMIDLLDPHNRAHTDPMRITALRIIDVALEVAGPSIAGQPALAQLVEDDLCRHLLQLVKSDNMVLLNSSLRVAGTLLATCRRILKLQQELFLSYLVACLHPRVDIPHEPGIEPALYEGVPQAPKLVKPVASQPNSGRSTPVPVKDRRTLGLEGGNRRPDAREAMVESIGTLIRHPTFMAELFVNYDCDVDCQDLCEDMVGLLARNAFPDAATWSTTNVPPLCLDSLLTFIQSMVDRIDAESSDPAQPDIDRLRAQRGRKKIIKAGAAKFNDNPKSGIVYLVQHGIIDNPDDPVQVARFLKSTTHVSKKVLGDFLTKKHHEQLLTAFIGLFQFDGQRIDEALRDLLTSFRLPGESALIERIVNVFTKKYCESDVPSGVADNDAAFVLTYAIIMLNTDLFNPNVKAQNRMTYADFAKNLRGVNAGQDFDVDYLQDIYDAIKQNEIILPDEHDNKHAFEYAWKELLRKAHGVGPLTDCTTNVFDGEMFNATWKPVIATLSYVFMSASDDAVFNRVVLGFGQCARLAARHHNTPALDRIVYSLTSVSGLATDLTPNTSLNTEVQAEKKTIMVSEVAVKFGRDYRAQLATVVLFRILAAHEVRLHDSWVYLIRVVRNLFVNSLISPAIPENHRMSSLPPIPLSMPSQVIDRDGKTSDAGLFSTFTSYLSSYAADDPPEPSEEEIENSLCAVDCMRACQPDLVLSRIYELPAAEIQHLVPVLLAQLPEEPTPVVVVKAEHPTSTTGRPHRVSRTGPVYHPSTVLLLELATVLTLRDDDTIAVAGESLTASLQTMVRDAANLHPLAASRIVLYLLDLLRLAYSHDFMRAPVVLHAISSFDDATLEYTAFSITRGLAGCIRDAGPLKNEVTNSPDFWSILQRLHQHKTEAGHVFDMFQHIISSTPPAVTADNYESTIALANDFATAGSVGTIQEQRRDLLARRGKQAKHAKHAKSGKQPKPDAPEPDPVVTRGLGGINTIYQLTRLVPALIAHSHLDYAEAWAAYWSPVFRSLSAQCVNPCREIRHRALSALQRSLLSDTLGDEVEHSVLFTDVLLPLIQRLLKPEIYQLDPTGMTETRIQAASLLCKIFLRYLDELVPGGRMLEVWLGILDLLERMLSSGGGASGPGEEGEAEAIPESLKNVLLVMAGSGYLKQPAKGEKEDLIWSETQKRLDRMLPGLLEELFPPVRDTQQEGNGNGTTQSREVEKEIVASA